MRGVGKRLCHVEARVIERCTSPAAHGPPYACVRVWFLGQDLPMQAIVLAAGYATRLGPLTEGVAKPLLALAGRPMVDYIYDKVAEVDGIDALHLVTNRRFAAAFEGWARKTARRRAHSRAR